MGKLLLQCRFAADAVCLVLPDWKEGAKGGFQLVFCKPNA